MSIEALEAELAFFDQHRTEWVKTYAGKFALIKGKRLVDTFTTFAEAYTNGVERFGRESFLIKCILPEDRHETIPALSLHLIDARLP